MIRRLTAVALPLLLVGVAAAEPTPPAAPPLKSRISDEARKDRRPVELICDRMVVLHRERRAQCSGRVTLKRGEMLLTCDRLDATYGTDGEVSAAVCRGNVHFFLPPKPGADGEVGEPREAGGEQADYDAERDVLVLKGKPWMRQGESVVRGRGIVYDLGAERMVIEQARGRLRMDRMPGTEPAP